MNVLRLSDRLSSTSDDRIHAAWETYCAAARKAQSTLCLADGVAAGRAWRAFLALYEGDGQRGPDRPLVPGP